MAFTISKTYGTVQGDLRTVILSCSVDSASGNIETGLSVVYGHTIAPISMATAAIIMKRNIGSGATARNGFININGAANGDVFCVIAQGK